MSRPLRCAVLAPLLLLCSCGGGDSLTLSNFPATYTLGFCERAAQCSGGLESVASCVRDREAGFEDGTMAALLAGIDAGRIELVATELSACIDALETLPCADFHEGLPPACAAAFVPRVALDGDCFIDAECSAGARCFPGCPGSCLRPGVAGAACSREGDCGVALTCASPSAGAALTCRERREEGAGCHGDYPELCRFGLSCTIGAEDLEYSCWPTHRAQSRAVGDFCALRGVSGCAGGLVCSADTATTGSQDFGICASPVASGEACIAANPDPCPTRQFCGADGRCRARSGDGGTCANGELCVEGLRCVAESCRAPARLGESCISDTHCASGHCGGAGRCVSPDQCE